eukprot:359314-Lingulodinium_polyedra.AAC.1
MSVPMVIPTAWPGCAAWALARPARPWSSEIQGDSPVIGFSVARHNLVVRMDRFQVGHLSTMGFRSGRRVQNREGTYHEEHQKVTPLHPLLL